MEDREARKEVFPLRLSKEERQMLKEKADALGLDRASFIRMLIKIADVSQFKERLWGREERQGR
ncbi:MAG: hypothetical protein A4E57_01291 [Syntrophorhabdaceae bacterium PtaU1.Bin034]|jgi:uncharacterized protein (DUF1778 family)|nr:MAG: hypothetical protein A4E57_01291 [Syntrophorhabdaceae bacterium PtaU1.Bin034]